MPRKKNQRQQPAEKSPEPGKPVTGQQHGPGIGEKFTRRFQHMVKPRTNQTGEPGDRNNQEALVLVLARGRSFGPLLRGGGGGQIPATINIRLQDVARDQQRGGHH